MNKIGIITKYYGSFNYGGCLQAYALYKYLTSIGQNAIQINVYNRNFNSSMSLLKYYKNNGLTETIKKVIKKSLNITKAISNKRIEKIINLRKNQIKEFNEKHIKATENVYDQFSIIKANDLFDAFFVGSDVVWNGIHSIDNVYLLPGIAKKKYSYAASITESISDEQKDIFREALAGFNFIGVREDKAKTIIGECVKEDVQVVLDPVFLLNPFQWSVVSSERLVPEKYVFCYLLGKDSDYKRKIEKFAKKNKLKIATIPYVKGDYSLSDSFFGDCRFDNASQADFLSLIQNAEYIFTDSFHCCAFSIIFEKQFLALERTDKDNQGMTSRLENILKKCGIENRIIRDPSAIESTVLKEIKYEVIGRRLDDEIKRSKGFLDKCIDSIGY